MFEDTTSITLHNALTGLAKRQRVIADNIANIQTPGFLAGRVSFEDSLLNAVEAGNPKEATIAVRRSMEPTREDGNNVNLDHEVLSNVDTGLRYQTMLRGVDDKFGLLALRDQGHVMTIFGAIGIAGTGATVYRKWLDAVADNIANMNNAVPTSGEVFRARYVQARAVGYGTGEGGVAVAGTALGDPKGRLVHEPENPLADREGYVKYPDIDLGSQMTQMMMAQRGYQANLTVVDRAKDAYQAAIQIGKG